MMEVQVNIRIFSDKVTEEVLMLSPDVSLKDVRTKLDWKRRPRPKLGQDFCFLVANDKLPIAREHHVSVVSILPKLFSGRSPCSGFIFPGTQYVKLRYKVKGLQADVLCAAVLFLVPAQDLNPATGWPVCLAYQPFVELLHFAPCDVQTVHILALYEAASQGNTDQLREELDYWPQQHCWEGTTPLHLAARNGHHAVCRQLLDHFGHGMVDVEDQVGRTPLQMALLWRRIEVAASLLEAGASLQPIQNSSGLTHISLISSLKLKDLGRLMSCLDFGKLDSVNVLKLFMKAAIVLHESEMVKRLIPYVIKSTSKRDNIRWTFLDYAINSRNLKVVESLCAAQENSTSTDWNGGTTLMLACQQGFKDAIPFLLPESVPGSIIGKALQKALDRGHWSVAEEILKLRGRKLMLDLETWHKVVIAWHNDFEALSRVVQSCPSEDENSYLLTRCLQQAAAVGDKQTLVVLSTNSNIDINTRDYLGHTALHEAVIRGHRSTVKMLLAHKNLEPNLTNWKGETALHCGCRLGQEEIVEELLKHELVDVDIQDSAGRTPILSALYWNRKEVVKILVTQRTSQLDFLKHDLQGMCVLHFASCLCKAGLLQYILDHVGLSHQCSPVQPVEHVGALTNSLGHTREALFTTCWEDTEASCKPPQSQTNQSYWVSRVPQPHHQRRKAKQPRKKSSILKKPPFRMAEKTITGCNGILHVAVIEHDIDVIQAVCTDAELLEQKDHLKRSPLDLAIDLLKPEIVSCILGCYKKLGVDQVLYPRLDTLERCLRADPVFDAESLPTRRLAVLTLLLNHGITPKHQINTIHGDVGDHLSLPVSVAAELGQENCVSALLKHGFCDTDGSALFAAVRSGSASILQKLLGHEESAATSQSSQNLEAMEDSKCPLGSNLLTTALRTANRNVCVVRRLLEACPHLVGIRAWKVSRKTVYKMTHRNNVMKVTDWRGNTPLEILMSQGIRGSIKDVTAQRQVIEDIGCLLVEQSSQSEVLAMKKGVEIHAVCAALPLALQKEYWKIVSALLKKCSTTLWECACSDKTVYCKATVGTLLEDVLQRLCHSQVPKELLYMFLQAGLALQSEGRLQEYTSHTSRQAWKLVLLHQNNEGPKDRECEVVYSQQRLPNVETPVDKVIMMALTQIEGQINRNPSETSVKPSMKTGVVDPPCVNLFFRSEKVTAPENQNENAMTPQSCNLLGIPVVPATLSPSAEMPATQAPATETTATQAPATETTATQAPATETTATQAPATETTATQAPATETTATQAPATETTATQAPATETTATQAPATETTATQAPATERTATQAPATERTATQAPATETTATQAPATERPATRPSAAQRPITRPPTDHRPTTRLRAAQRPTTRPQTDHRPTTRLRAAQRPITQAQTDQRPTTRLRAAQRPITQAQTDQRPTTRLRAAQRPRTQLSPGSVCYTPASSSVRLTSDGATVTPSITFTPYTTSQTTLLVGSTKRKKRVVKKIEGSNMKENWQPVDVFKLTVAGNSIKAKSKNQKLRSQRTLKSPLSCRFYHSIASILLLRPNIPRLILAPTVSEDKSLLLYSRQDKVVGEMNRFYRDVVELASDASHYKSTLFHEACLQGHEKLVRRLLETAPVSELHQSIALQSYFFQLGIDAMRKESWWIVSDEEENVCIDRLKAVWVSALGSAAIGGHVGVVKLLLEKGWQPNWEDVALSTIGKGKHQRDKAEEIAALLSDRVIKECDVGCAVVLLIFNWSGNYQLLETVLRKAAIAAPSVLMHAINVALEKHQVEFAVPLLTTIKSRWPSDFDSPAVAQLLQDALCPLVSRGRTEVVLWLMSVMPIENVLAAGNDGQTIWHYVARFGQVSILQYLIQRCCEVTAPSMDSKDSGDTCKDLKEILSTRDRAIRTPLWYALVYKHWDVAALLLVHGGLRSVLQSRVCKHPICLPFWMRSTDRDQQERIRFTPELDVHIAEGADGDRDARVKVKILLQCAQLADRLKTTLLHSACILGDTSTVELILHYTPSAVNQVDGHRRSPLLCALLNGNYETAQVLIKAGAKAQGEPCILGLFLYIIISQTTTVVDLRTDTRHVRYLDKCRNDSQRICNARLFQIRLQEFFSQCIHQALERFVQVLALSGEKQPRSDALILDTCMKGILDHLAEEVDILSEADCTLLMVLVAALPYRFQLWLLEQNFLSAAHKRFAETCKEYSLLDVLIHWSPCFGDRAASQDHISQQEERLITGVLQSSDEKGCDISIQTGSLIVACQKHMTGLVYKLMCILRHKHWDTLDGQIAFIRGLIYLLQHRLVKDFSTAFKILDESNFRLRLRLFEPVKESSQKMPDNSEGLNRETWLTVLLQMAVFWRSYDIAAILLQYGASPVARINRHTLENLDKLKTFFSVVTGLREDWSAFHIACTLHDRRGLDLLSKNLSEIEIVCAEKLEKHFGVELQFLAARFGDKPALEWCQRIGMDITGSLTLPQTEADDQRVDNQSLAHIAARNGHFYIVEYLLNYWTRSEGDKLPTKAKPEQSNLFHYAARFSDCSSQVLIRKLLDLNFEGIDALDEHGITPCQYAYHLGNLKTLAYLFDEGKTVNQETFICQSMRWTGVLKTIVGANAQQQFLHVGQVRQSSWYSSDDVVYWLIQRDRVSSDLLPSHTAYTLQACSIGGLSRALHLLVHELQSRGELDDIINQQSPQYLTALAHAVVGSRITCIKILGVFRDAINWNCPMTGENLLHLAVRTRQEATIATLLEVADVETQQILIKTADYYGSTPEDYAKALGVQHLLASHVKGDWSKPTVQPLCHSLFGKFTADPTNETKMLLMQHLHRGNLQIGIQLYEYAIKGEAKQSSLLSVEELIHSAVTYCDISMVKKFMKTLKEKFKVCSVDRYHGMSLAEHALLAGRRELSLWLASNFTDQFVRDAGLGCYKRLLPLRVRWLTGLTDLGDKGWMRSVSSAHKRKLNQADVWLSACWNPEELKMMTDLHDSWDRPALLPEMVEVELSVDLREYMVTLGQGQLKTQVLLASSLALGRVLCDIKGKDSVDDVKRIRLECSVTTGQNENPCTIGICEAQDGTIVRRLGIIKTNMNIIHGIVDAVEVIPDELKDQGHVLIHSAKEHVEKSVVPALVSTIKKKLDLDIQVSVGWDSLLPLDFGEEEVRKSLSIIDAIRFSQCAGIGAAIDSCVIFAQTISSLQGPQVWKETLEDARNHVKPICIECVSKPDRATQNINQVSWEFDIKEERLVCMPHCLPFWYSIWWQYLVAINLQNAAIMLVTNVKEPRSRYPVFRVNFQTLSEIIGVESVSQVVAGPLRETANGMAAAFESRLHLKWQVEKVEISFCRNPDKINIRRIKPSTLSLCLLVHHDDSVNNGSWGLTAPDFAATFSEMEVNDLVNSAEGMLASARLYSSLEDFRKKISKIFTREVLVHGEVGDILIGVVKDTLKEMTSPVSIAKTFIAKWVEKATLEEELEAHINYIGTRLWKWMDLEEKHQDPILYLWFASDLKSVAGSSTAKACLQEVKKGRYELKMSSRRSSIDDDLFQWIHVDISDLQSVALNLGCSVQDLLEKVQLVSLGKSFFRPLDASYMKQLYEDIPVSIRCVWEKGMDTKGKQNLESDHQTQNGITGHQTVALRQAFIHMHETNGGATFIPRNMKPDVQMLCDQLPELIRIEKNSFPFGFEMRQFEKLMTSAYSLFGLGCSPPLIKHQNRNNSQHLEPSNVDHPRRLKDIFRAHSRLFEELGVAVRFLGKISANFKECLLKELKNMEFTGGKTGWNNCPVSFKGGPLEVLLPLFRKRLQNHGAPETETVLPDQVPAPTASSLIQLVASTRPDLLNECDLTTAVFPGACTVHDEDLNILLFPRAKHPEASESLIRLQLRNALGNPVKVTEKLLKGVDVTLKVKSRHQSETLSMTKLCDSSNIMKVTWTDKEVVDFQRYQDSPVSIELRINGEHIQGSSFPMSPELRVHPLARFCVGELVPLYFGHDKVCVKTLEPKQHCGYRRPSEYLQQKECCDMRDQGWLEEYSGIEAQLFVKCQDLQKLDSLPGSDCLRRNVVQIRCKPVHGQAHLHSADLTSFKPTKCQLKARCRRCGEAMWLVAPGLSKSSELELRVCAGKPCVETTRLVKASGAEVATSKTPTWVKWPEQKLKFFIQIRDKAKNAMFDSQASGFPVFTFLNHFTDDVLDNLTCTIIDASRGILKVSMPSVSTRAGTFTLMMDHKHLGKNELSGYFLKVLPGPVYAGACRTTAPDTKPGELSSIFVMLRDKYNNDIKPSIQVVAKMKVSFQMMDIKTYINVVDHGKVEWRYIAPANFTGKLRLEVLYENAHVHNSPLTVVVSRGKTFVERLKAFRKKLIELKKSEPDGYCTLRLRRDQVLNDTMKVFDNCPPHLLYMKMKVSFIGEQGLDLGGLTKEWYHLLSREIFNPDYALFEETEDGQCRINSKSVVHQDHLDYFRFIGKVFAKAIFDGENLDVKLVKTVYKNLLDQPAEADDLLHEDATLYKSLMMLAKMSAPEDVAAMCLTFAINEMQFGQMLNIDLKPGGSSEEVCLANRMEYIALYTAFALYGRIGEQLAHLKTGFNSVIPLDMMKDFSHEEFEHMLCGQKQINFQLLQQYTTYSNGYGPDSKQIIWLWKLLRSWTQNEGLCSQVPQFLMFVTGSTRLPVYMRDWRLTIRRGPASDGLPTSSTCFNILQLPAYGHESELREKVLKAVVLGSEGFGRY